MCARPSSASPPWAAQSPPPLKDVAVLTTLPDNEVLLLVRQLHKSGVQAVVSNSESYIEVKRGDNSGVRAECVDFEGIVTVPGCEFKGQTQHALAVTAATVTSKA